MSTWQKLPNSHIPSIPPWWELLSPLPFFLLSLPPLFSCVNEYKIIKKDESKVSFSPSSDWAWVTLTLILFSGNIFSTPTGFIRPIRTNHNVKQKPKSLWFSIGISPDWHLQRLKRPYSHHRLSHCVVWWFMCERVKTEIKHSSFLKCGFSDYDKSWFCLELSRFPNDWKFHIITTLLYQVSWYHSGFHIIQVDAS